MGGELAADIKGDRRARMNEHPVTATTEEERNGLVLQLALRPHGIADKSDDSLSALVQPRERFAKAIDPFVRRKLERGRDVAREIAGPAHEREGDVGRKRRRFAESLGPREY